MAIDQPVPAVYMRGGTSKGVFLHARDLPPAGAERDDLLLRIMGSPDPLQIDGMGGTFSSTSKVVVVEPGPEGAVTYWFAQVGVDRALVDWSGNCGNLTTAVGPFAIDEGLVPATGATTTVQLVNGNTGVRIEAIVETPDDRAATTGSLQVAGVPGSGSPVVTRYLDPAGGVLGSLLPLGAPTVELETPDGVLRASIVDAAHPNVFALSSDFGLAAAVPVVSDLNADAEFLARVERFRAAAAVRVGRAPDPATATASSPAVPRVILVAPPVDDEADVVIVAFSMGVVHRGLPMSGGLCLAAAAGVPGSIVSEVIGASKPRLRIRHALGVTEVEAEMEADGEGVRSLGVVRTARRLMDGRAYPRPRL